jgi:hypothetical protein
MNPDEAYAILEMVHEYFEDLADVVDGSYGEPSPNKEMQMAQRVRDVLDWLEKL